MQGTTQRKARITYFFYLSPDRSFKNSISPDVKIFQIMKSGKMFTQNFFLNDKEIQLAIQKMDYKNFLKTPYWDGVRNYKLKRAGYCCELCKSKGILNVHHKSYKNHGSEHLESVADNDLIVLCRNCHAKFHDKLAEQSV